MRKARPLSSFDQTQQRILLDRFGGLSTDAVAEAYARWRTATEKLEELIQGEQDRLRMVDLWSYQRKEIEAARASNPAKTMPWKPKNVCWPMRKSFIPPPWGLLSNSTRGGASAEVALRAALRNVEELARYDSRFQESAQQLESARATVGDVGTSLRDYAEGINASPGAPG